MHASLLKTHFCGPHLFGTNTSCRTPTTPRFIPEKLSCFAVFFFFLPSVHGPYVVFVFSSKLLCLWAVSSVVTAPPCDRFGRDTVFFRRTCRAAVASWMTWPVAPHQLSASSTSPRWCCSQKYWDCLWNGSAIVLCERIIVWEKINLYRRKGNKKKTCWRLRFKARKRR